MDGGGHTAGGREGDGGHAPPVPGDMLRGERTSTAVSAKARAPGLRAVLNGYGHLPRLCQPDRCARPTDQLTLEQVASKP